MRALVAFYSLTGNTGLVAARIAALRPAGHAPQDYDLVIVAGPVWAGRVAPPVRSYLAAHRGRFRNVAFCLTHGGPAAGDGFRRMEDIAQARPVATLSMQAADIAAGEYDAPVRAFARRLQEGLGRPHLQVAGAQAGAQTKRAV